MKNLKYKRILLKLKKIKFFNIEKYEKSKV